MRHGIRNVRNSAGTLVRGHQDNSRGPEHFESTNARVDHNSLNLMVAWRFERTMGLSRATVFLDVEGIEGALQTDDPGCSMGDLAATSYHDHLLGPVWQVGPNTV